MEDCKRTNNIPCKDVEDAVCWWLNDAVPANTCYTYHKNIGPKGAGTGPNQWRLATNGDQGPPGSMEDCKRTNNSPCTEVCSLGTCKTDEDCCSGTCHNSHRIQDASFNRYCDGGYKPDFYYKPVPAQ